MENNHLPSSDVKQSVTHQFTEQLSMEGPVTRTDIEPSASPALRLFYQNTGGISSVQNKLRKFNDYFKHRNYYDIICVTESWLHAKISDHQILSKDFNIFRRDRHETKEVKAKSKGGGVMIAIRKDYRARRCENLETDLEIVWCEIRDGKRSVYVGTVYIPPGRKTEVLDKLAKLDQSLDKLYEKFDVDNDEIILTGDFNLPDIVWRAGVSPHRYTSAKSKRFCGLLAKRSLIQRNSLPTCSGHVLDLVFTSHPNCELSYAGNVVGSDHLALQGNVFTRPLSVNSNDKIATKPKAASLETTRLKPKSVLPYNEVSDSDILAMLQLHPKLIKRVQQIAKLQKAIAAGQSKCRYKGEEQNTRHLVMKHLPREDAPYRGIHIPQISATGTDVIMKNNFEEKHPKVDTVAGVGGTKKRNNLNPPVAQIMSETYAGLKLKLALPHRYVSDVLTMLKGPKLMQEVRKIVKLQKDVAEIEATVTPVSVSSICTTVTTRKVQSIAFSRYRDTTPPPSNFDTPSPLPTTSDFITAKPKLSRRQSSSKKKTTRTAAGHIEATKERKRLENHKACTKNEQTDESNKAGYKESAKGRTYETKNISRHNRRESTKLKNENKKFTNKGTTTNIRVRHVNGKKNKKGTIILSGDRKEEQYESRQKTKEFNMPKKDRTVNISNDVGASKSRKRHSIQDTTGSSTPKQKRTKAQVTETVAPVLSDDFATIKAAKEQLMPREQDLRPIPNQPMATNTNLSAEAANSNGSDLPIGIDEMTEAASGMSALMVGMARAMKEFTAEANKLDRHVVEQTSAIRSAIKGSIDSCTNLTSAMQTKAETFRTLASRLATIANNHLKSEQYQ